MSEDKKQIEVGDVIYDYGRWGGLERRKVTKVSPQQAVAGEWKIKREILHNKHFDTIRAEVKLIGSYGYALVETEELKRKFEEQNLIRKAQQLHRDYDIKSINVEKAIEIINLYEKILPNLEKVNQ